MNGDQYSTDTVPGGVRQEACDTCNLERPKGAGGGEGGVKHGPTLLRCLQDGDWTVRAAAVTMSASLPLGGWGPVA